MKTAYDICQYCMAYGPWLILAGALAIDLYKKFKKPTILWERKH